MQPAEDTIKVDKQAVEDGELDIDYGCGCVAECRLEQGHPVWTLIYLCEEHDPTIEEVKK